MGEISEWAQSAIEPLRDAMGLVVAFLPNLFGALLLLVVGWIVATILRRLGRRSLEGAGWFIRKLPGLREKDEWRFSHIGTIVLSNAVFWAVVIVFVVFAAQLLELEIFTSGIHALLNYLPAFVAGVAIMLAGIVFGGLAYPVVTQSARAAGLPQSELSDASHSLRLSPRQL